MFLDVALILDCLRLGISGLPCYGMFFLPTVSTIYVKNIELLDTQNYYPIISQANNVVNETLQLTFTMI